MSDLVFLFNVELEVPAREVCQANETQCIQIGKEEGKVSLFTDYLSLYTENSKESTKKLLELINGFSKFAGYKINIKKSIAFLYINNKI